MEDEEEEDDVDNDGEEENKTNRSNPDVKGNVEPSTTGVDVKPETSNRSKRAEEVGYSLLDGQDATEDEPEAVSSSCSSDLSFGASSSGKDHNPSYK